MSCSRRTVSVDGLASRPHNTNDAPLAWKLFSPPSSRLRRPRYDNAIPMRIHRTRLNYVFRTDIWYFSKAISAQAERKYENYFSDTKRLILKFNGFYLFIRSVDFLHVRLSAYVQIVRFRWQTNYFSFFFQQPQVNP